MLSKIINAYNAPITESLVLASLATKLTLLGIPVVVDSEKYPKGVIRLILGKEELARIECLAIPSAFMSDEDYTEEGRKKESDKFYNLR
jgi:hypothetical protein